MWKALIIPILVPLVWVLWLWLGKRGIRTNRTAILATAIPPTPLAIAAVVHFFLNLEAIRGAGGDEINIGDICIFISFGLAVLAILSSFVFAITGKWEIAKGAGFGGGIGFAVGVIAVILMIVFHYG